MECFNIAAPSMREGVSAQDVRDIAYAITGTLSLTLTLTGANASPDASFDVSGPFASLSDIDIDCEPFPPDVSMMSLNPFSELLWLRNACVAST